MLKALLLAASSLLVVALLPIALAPQNAAGQSASAPVDKALFDNGQKLYADNCAVCHQPDGTGMPPDFPVLVGNQRLGDLTSIVRNVRNGQGPMPAFPKLTDADVAAVATYVRNAWTNKVGGVTSQQVTAALDTLAKAGPQVSIWAGVYSAAQAMAGQPVYSGNCAKCHGRTGNGVGEPDAPKSPTLVRDAFLRKWDGRTFASLFEYVRTAMPQDNPHSREDKEYIDALAYVLSLGGLPAGAKELPVDLPALATIVIKRMP